MADKENTQRRVYVLPTELVERIVAFQEEMGMQSEVEAARRLLDQALKSRDDWRTITRRFKDKLKQSRDLSEIAKEVLMGHPLLRSLTLEGNAIKFGLTTGEVIEIDVDGEVAAQDEDGRFIEYEPKPKGGGFSRDMDDDIPF